jgi:hypothetical protein
LERSFSFSYSFSFSQSVPVENENDYEKENEVKVSRPLLVWGLPHGNTSTQNGTNTSVPPRFTCAQMT